MGTLKVSLTTAVGREARFTFNEMTRKGMQWKCEPCDGVDVTSALVEGPKGSFGGPEKREFTMVASLPGEYDLDFKYVSPTEVFPVDEMKLTLYVKPRLLN